MTPYEPMHRAALLEALYALDSFVWYFRSQIDQKHDFSLHADDLCAHEYANRTASLFRTLLDEDVRRRGPRPQYTPTDADHRVKNALEARRAREARAAQTAAASSPDPFASGAEERPPHADAWPTSDSATGESPSLSEARSLRIRRRAP